MSQPVDRALSSEERFEQLHACLRGIEVEQKELFAKTGRSRTATFSLGHQRPLRIESQVAQEAGHALRAGDQTTSFAWLQSGWPNEQNLKALPRSLSSPGALRLPTPEIAVAQLESPAFASATASRDALDRPLLSEREVRNLAEVMEAQLKEELTKPFQLSGRLSDGAAESWLVNGHGLRASSRTRTTSLRVDLAFGGEVLSTYLASARDGALRPQQVAQRLIDRALIGSKATSFSAGSTTVLLAPQVAGTLLAAVAADFLRPPPSSDPHGLSACLSIQDEPDATLGIVQSTTDGEGVATRTVELIAKGKRCGWLKPWDWVRESDQTKGEGERFQTPPTGCRFRNSWREMPTPRCSNLVVEVSDLAPRQLMADVERGAYLIASNQVAQHTEDGLLLLPSVGFAIDQGDTAGPIRTTLAFPKAELLSRVAAVGRDAELFVPSGPAAAVCTPSLLLQAVELGV